MSEVENIIELNTQFVGDLCVLMRNDKERYESFFKSLKKNPDYFDYRHSKETIYRDEAYRITRHAVLNHSFSLFEILTKNLIEIIFHNDEEAKKLVRSQWHSYFENCENPQVNTRIFDSDKELLRNINHLRHHLKKDPESYLSILINAENYKDNDISEHRANVYIYRSIRNCLTHRGNEIDKKLLEDLFNRSPNYVRKSKSLKRFRKSHAEKDENIDHFDTSKLRGIEIKVSIAEIFRSLIFISTWYLSISYEKLGGKNEIMSPMAMVFHEVLEANESQPNNFLLLGCRQLFRVVHKLIYKRNHDLVKDVDKYNYFLVEGLGNDIGINNQKKYINRLKKSSANIQKIKDAEAELKERRRVVKKNKTHLTNIFFKFEKLPEIFKSGNSDSLDKFIDDNYAEINNCLVSILDAHFNNRCDQYIDAIRSLPIHNMQQMNYVKNWFVMRKYKKNKKYIEMLKAKERNLGG